MKTLDYMFEIPRHIRRLVNIGASKRKVPLFNWDQEQYSQARKKIETGDDWEEVLKGSGLPLDRLTCDNCNGSGMAYELRWPGATPEEIGSISSNCSYCFGKGYI